MNLIEHVKNYSGNLALKQTIANGTKEAQPVSFEQATKFAVLFYVREEAEMNAVNDFISFLWSKKKSTFIIGATTGFPVAKSKVTNMNFIQLREDEITWNNIPKGYRITNYLENEFDILIDLTQEDYFPLLYVLAAAKAKIKVGRYDRNKYEQYHFMVDTWRKPDIYNFTTQIKQYLQSL